ncbi:lactate permease LctP family transporter [Porphyromonas pogonae]|uniref:L-lactate permease n=1 Tax=Porphyromonas pogonae TaxID=867595 RepID=UPI002E7A184E|nr:lactate permease LctP family transporter [Porphyromonas pogonae]
MSVILSLLPILLLIVLMVGFKMAGDKSAVIALLTAAVIALFAAPALGFAPSDFYHGGVFWAFIEGALKAIFPILIIILMAIYSYNVLLESKKIEVIKQQFVSISEDKSIQVLLLVWGFGGLLEGMAGFGTAVAIPAAILISLGFKPGFSALVSLIANSVATGFGAVGVPVMTLANEVAQSGTATTAEVQQISANVVLQLSLLMFIIPYIILFLTDKSAKSQPKNIVLALLVGGVSLGVQYAAARYLGAETPAIFGSLASILVIILFAKITAKKGSEAKPKVHFTGKQLFEAWSVYLFILVFIVLASPLSGPISQFLKTHLVSKVALPIYHAGKTFNFGWLSNAGLMLFLGAFIGGLIQGLSVSKLLAILGKTFINLKKSGITIISLVAMSSIMTYSGMILVIATALAEATGQFYPLVAPLIGAIGTFVTGSDTSSNILFGKLQAGVANQIGVNTNWLAAANTAGATGGKIISPQSIAIATASCNQQGQEGAILRSSIPYALFYVVIAGLMVYFMVPAV